jgi:tripartite-type tricarboxylate transporter receptor subunit TctC
MTDYINCLGGAMKLKLIIAALSIFVARPPLYGQSFPNKPIELVVSSSPGGGVDLIFRLIAEDLAKNLKTQINVANQTAGAGAIAAEKVAAARKDGYTLLGTLLGQVATMSVANPKAPANLLRDFQPIAILNGYAAVIMLGRADSDIKTLKDLVAQAQKKPGDLIVAVGPPGTSLTLEVELLKRAAKVDITSLPFAGSAQGITNLLGGHVNFAMASDVAAQPHIKAGKLVGIAVDVESAVLPDVPTFAKQGYPQVNLLASVAFLAPKGLPDTTAKILTDGIKKTVDEPKLKENLKSRGYNVDLRTSTADLNKLIKDEVDKYSRFTPEDLGWKAQ